MYNSDLESPESTGLTKNLQILSTYSGGLLVPAPAAFKVSPPRGQYEECTDYVRLIRTAVNIIKPMESI